MPLKLKMRQSNQSCLEHIAAVSCISQQTTGGYEPHCPKANLSVEQMEKIREIIDFLPEIHREVFCQINQLKLHDKNLKSVAYASVIGDEKGNFIGSQIGMRLNVLLNHEENKDLFSWKEQLSFGLTSSDNPEVISQNGPLVSLEIKNANKPQLYYVFIHEINHLIDFMNNVTKFQCDSEKCTVNPQSFTAFSWPLLMENAEIPKEVSLTYPLLSKMCFYYCNEFIPVSMMGTIYEALTASSFVTSYSISNPYEDFADFATIFTLYENSIDFNYLISDKNGSVLFDVKNQWEKPHMDSKKRFVEDFFRTPGIKTKF